MRAAKIAVPCNSGAHAETSRELSSVDSRYSEMIDVRYVRGYQDWLLSLYDVAWSLNILYQIADHPETYARQASSP